MTCWVRVYVLLGVAFWAGLAHPQNVGMRLIATQPRQRELWFAHWRLIPGQSAAALRYRAHRQKLELRALRAAAPRSAGAIAFPRVDPGTAWTPLGTAPLASDASGLGVQDYGLVAAPADSTGNTVYIGGAYGGVWKSASSGALSANSSSVTCGL